MGEAQNNLFELEFSRSIKVQSTDHRLTSVAGSCFYAHQNHSSGSSTASPRISWTPRTPVRMRYSVAELLRKRIFATAIGASAQDDLDRLAHAGRSSNWGCINLAGERLILVVVDEPPPQTGQLNLLQRYFFLVTNWRTSLVAVGTCSVFSCSL